MGTLVNGIKEIFATAKTTGSNVMLCGNDGTPDGHITMANLASVLGEPINIASNDVDGITHTGVYRITKCTNNPFGSNSTAILYVTKLTEGTNIFIRQVAVRVTSGVEACKIRWYWASTGWTAWKDDAIDYPTFYKNYNDLSSLASALGVQIESFTSNSHYGYTFPTSDGFAIKLAINAYSFVLFCLGDSGKLYYKYIWQGSDNMDWQLINVVQK